MSDKELIEKAMELAKQLDLAPSHYADTILRLVKRVEELQPELSIVWEPKEVDLNVDPEFEPDLNDGDERKYGFGMGQPFRVLDEAQLRPLNGGSTYATENERKINWSEKTGKNN